MDRDELFEKARGDILDEVINLSLISPQKWEDALSKKLWEKVAPYVFENIYLPAAQSRSSSTPARPISTYSKTGMGDAVWCSCSMPSVSEDNDPCIMKQELSIPLSTSS